MRTPNDYPQVFGNALPLTAASFRRQHSLWLEYGTSLSLTFGFLLLRLATGSVGGEGLTFSLLLLPIIFSAFFGGLGPGLLSTALLALGSNLALSTTAQGMDAAIARTLMLLVCGTTLSLLCERLIRQRAETEASLQFQLLTLSSLTEAIIVCDTEARISFINTQAETLTGWNNAAAQGCAVSDVFNLLHQQTREPLASPVKEALATGNSIPLASHSLLVPQDGRECLLEGTAIPILYQDGRIYGVALLFRDCTQERAAEAALLGREQQLTNTLSVLPVGVGLLFDRIIHEGNPQLAQLLGYSMEELIDLPTRLLYESDEEYERVGTTLWQQLAHENRALTETRWQRKDGNWLDILLAASLQTPGHSQGGIVFAAQEIDRYRQQEQTLSQQITHLQQALETAQLGSFTLTLETQTLTLDEQARKHYQTSENTLPVAHYLQLVHPDDQSRVREALEELIESAGISSRNCDYTHRLPAKPEHADSTERWLQISLRPVKTIQHKTAQLSYSASIQDITTRRSAEAAQNAAQAALQTQLEQQQQDKQQQTAQVQTLLDLLPDPVWINSDGGICLYANLALAKLLEQPLVGLTGQPIAKHWPATLTSQLGALEQQTCRTLAPQSLEITLPAAATSNEGTEPEAALPSRRFTLTLAPVLDSSGKLLGTVAHAQDQHAEQQLEQLQDAAKAALLHERQQQGNFLGHTSRALLTPLETIHNLAQIGLRNNNPQTLAPIASNSAALVAQLQALQTLVQLQSGQLPLVHEPFLLGDCLDQAITETSLRLSTQKHLHLEIIESTPLPYACEGDAGRLYEILGTLLDNSIRLSPRGTLQLEYGFDGHNLHFKLHDTSGLTPQEMAARFKLQQQTEDADPEQLTRNFQLAITEQLIRLHQGELHIGESPLTSAGRNGCCLSVNLPLVIQAERDTPQPSLKGLHLVSMGLSANVLTSLQPQLQSAGAELHILRHGDPLPENTDLLLTEAHSEISSGLLPAMVQRLQALREKGIAIAILAQAGTIRHLPANLRQRWLESPLRLRHLLPMLDPDYVHPASHRFTDSTLPVTPVPSTTASPVDIASMPSAPSPELSPAENESLASLFPPIDWDKLQQQHLATPQTLRQLCTTALYTHRNSGKRLHDAANRKDYAAIVQLCQQLDETASTLAADPLSSQSKATATAAEAAQAMSHASEIGARAAAEIAVQAQLPLLLETLDAAMTALQAHLDQSGLVFQ